MPFMSKCKNFDIELKKNAQFKKKLAGTHWCERGYGFAKKQTNKKQRNNIKDSGEAYDIN